MIRTVALKYSAVTRMTWIQALEYKSNTIVGIFAIITGILIEFLLWDRIYDTRGLEVINGYTLNQLMVYIFFALMVGQLKSSWVTAFEMIESIRSGDMNKYLIRPISFYAYHFALFIGYNSLFYFSYLIMVTSFQFIFPGWALHTFAQTIAFVGFLGLAITLSYSLYFMMICCAFWFGEVRTLILAYNLANRVFAGAIIPLSFFPETALTIIRSTPVPYLIDIPVNVALGNIPSSEWGGLFLTGSGWLLITVSAGLGLYRLGIRRYEGFGG